MGGRSGSCGSLFFDKVYPLYQEASRSASSRGLGICEKVEETVSQVSKQKYLGGLYGLL